MTYDGLDERSLARLLAAPLVVARSTLPSTLDLAHQLGATNAPSGSVVLADEQTAGRGRQGRTWHSPAGAGVWMAVLLRPARPPRGGALAIRAGLALVEAVAEAAPELAPRLKWPNDLIVAGLKAGGVLCEARWSGDQLGWVAVGIGINVKGSVAAAVRDRAIALADVAPGVTRLGLATALVPRVARLGALPPELDQAERERFVAVSWSGGAGEPQAVGLDSDGALLVRAANGELDRRVIAS